jgi:hypothetical protein
LDNNSRGCIRRRVRPPAPRRERDAARKGCGDEGRVSTATPYKFHTQIFPPFLLSWFSCSAMACAHFLRDSSTTHTHIATASFLALDNDDGLENINTKMFRYCSKFIATSSLSQRVAIIKLVHERRPAQKLHSLTLSLSLPPHRFLAPCTTQQLDAESPILSFNMNNGPPT